MTHVAVVDFGKTNVKVALVDREALSEIAVRSMRNVVQRGIPFPHYATEEHWEFLLRALSELHRSHGVDAISVTTHGATAALVDGEGELVLPILDYETPLPDGIAAEYDRVRPPFALTGSPRLGAGLNLGAQLYWQWKVWPGAWARARHLLTYPQYWGFRLTGMAATEATSLGCHTDLWNPEAGGFSPLVEHMGWTRLMPPLRAASDVLGRITGEVAALTGLTPGTPVACGIHDSNASLYPHLMMREAPFSVVSTGTWVIAMAVGAPHVALDPERDTLINTGGDGRSVPSARFMGGREYEIIRDGSDASPAPADRAAALGKGLHLLPAVEPGTGPFRGAGACWTAEPETEGERILALSWYLAGMTAECLSMLAAQGVTVVEGPFGRNRDYLEMLATMTGRPVVVAEKGETGTALGAALLIEGPGPVMGDGDPILPVDALQAHARGWQEACRRHVAGAEVVEDRALASG